MLWRYLDVRVVEDLGERHATPRNDAEDWLDVLQSGLVGVVCKKGRDFW